MTAGERGDRSRPPGGRCAGQTERSTRPRGLALPYMPPPATPRKDVVVVNQPCWSRVKVRLDDRFYLSAAIVSRNVQLQLQRFITPRSKRSSWRYCHSTLHHTTVSTHLAIWQISLFDAKLYENCRRTTVPQIRNKSKYLFRLHERNRDMHRHCRSFVTTNAYSDQDFKLSYRNFLGLRSVDLINCTRGACLPLSKVLGKIINWKID